MIKLQCVKFSIYSVRVCMCAVCMVCVCVCVWCMCGVYVCMCSVCVCIVYMCVCGVCMMCYVWCVMWGVCVVLVEFSSESALIFFVGRLFMLLHFCSFLVYLSCSKLFNLILVGHMYLGIFILKFSDLGKYNFVHNSLRSSRFHLNL